MGLGYLDLLSDGSHTSHKVKTTLVALQVSRRLSQVEDKIAERPQQLSHGSEPHSDQLLYESQPLLTGGPSSNPLPNPFTFSLQKVPLAFDDALSSDQSLDPYQQQPLPQILGWDLLVSPAQDLASMSYEDPARDPSHTLNSYTPLEEDARSYPEVRSSRPSNFTFCFRECRPGVIQSFVYTKM